MDQTIVNWMLGCVGGLLGFLLNSLWAAVKDLQSADKVLAEKVESIEVLVAGAYVKKDEFHNIVSSLLRGLERIEDKLDRKVDK